MSDILKKPYEISLWEDKQVFVQNIGGVIQTLEEPVEGVAILNNYFKEEKIAVIGSYTMDAPIRTFEPVLTEDLNGSKTLTFQVYSKYWDEGEEVFKKNPFVKYLCNERKIKLYYNDEWLDFIIKQVQENSDSSVFTYTCKDLFVNELGKTGYEVELNTELQNNMGTVKELAEKVLDGTDWSEKNSDIFYQFNQELLYEYTLSSALNATAIFDQQIKRKISQPITIPSGATIYVFYSSYMNKESEAQFFYVPNGHYQTDENNFIINSLNYTATVQDSFYVDSAPLSGYFGKKVIFQQKTLYIPEIEDVCSVWTKNNQTYYSYMENEYASVSEIQNMLSNSSSFDSLNGWSTLSTNNVINLSTATVIPSSAQGSTIQSCLRTTFGESSPNNFIINSGFYDNRAALSPNGFVQGEKYIFAAKYQSDIGNISAVYIYWRDASAPINNFTIATIATPIGQPPSMLDGYTVFEGIVNRSIPYSGLLTTSGIVELRVFGSGTVNILDVKVFKYLTDANGVMIVPDLQNTANSIIRKKYNFFLKPNSFDGIEGKQDLEIAESLYDTNGYTPVVNYNKISSINGSKSNRFNLIQSLCETFECWARFTIEHSDNGQVYYEYKPLLAQNDFKEGRRYYTRISGTSVTDDTEFAIVYEPVRSAWATYFEKKYSKFVTFKEYIGKDNEVGFRYGINLKSIQRGLVSDQIATKVIVEPNTNDAAPNGFCTIQQAKLNPTGDNALYNLNYYVNQGLINKEGLQKDLFDEEKGLGFYVKMKRLNQEVESKIEEQVQINKSLNLLSSRLSSYELIEQEAWALYNELNQRLISWGYSDSMTNVPLLVQTTRTERDSHKKTAEDYANITQNTRELVTTYENRLEAILEELNEIAQEKQNITNEFNKKYSNFIQEGTWTSNDYYDPEMYYQAANMVAYKSAFPQVSYTISVLELSQLEEYKAYTFDIADKTYIQDTEFFGYDDRKRPYKEEIVISQLKKNLDDASKNVITVRNYKTDFQDLFQRMAATSQSLQYQEGAFKRAANAIEPTLEINPNVLQNSLEANSAIIKNAKNQNVIWDDSGISISNFVNANEIVKITSGGIAFSNSGGQDWTTGITGDGINANLITTGQLDTNLIRIFDSNQQTFEWKGDTGISAFKYDNTAGRVDFGNFVRFDQYGVYGYSGDPNWSAEDIDDVINDTTFSLTWEGLRLHSTNNNEYSKVDASTYSPGDSPVAKGWYEWNETLHYYVLSADTVIDEDKDYYREGTLFVSLSTNEDEISPSDPLYNKFPNQKKVFWGGFEGEEDGAIIKYDNFVIFNDGRLYARGGYFEGDIVATSFQGEIVTDEIKDGAVTSAKIAAMAVGETQLSNNAVTQFKINDLAVTTDKINNKAVTTGKIANNAVTYEQIASNTIRTGNIDPQNFYIPPSNFTPNRAIDFTTDRNPLQSGNWKIYGSTNHDGIYITDGTDDYKFNPTTGTFDLV